MSLTRGRHTYWSIQSLAVAVLWIWQIKPAQLATWCTIMNSYSLLVEWSKAIANCSLFSLRHSSCVRCDVLSDPVTLSNFCVTTQQNATFGGVHPGGYEPKFELGRDFRTVHLPPKFHHPMFTRSEVIVLTNKHTNKRMPLKTSNALCCATT